MLLLFSLKLSLLSSFAVKLAPRDWKTAVFHDDRLFLLVREVVVSFVLQAELQLAASMSLALRGHADLSLGSGSFSCLILIVITVVTLSCPVVYLVLSFFDRWRCEALEGKRPILVYGMNTTLFSCLPCPRVMCSCGRC